MAARLSILWEHSLRGGPLSGDADDRQAREYRYCRFLAEIIMRSDVSGYGDERELALNCRVSNCRPRAGPGTLRQVSGRWWRSERGALAFAVQLPAARFRRERARILFPRRGFP